MSEVFSVEKRELMEALRQRKGLNKDDTTMDETLDELPPSEKFREWCAWELGCASWAFYILRAARASGVAELNKNS